MADVAAILGALGGAGGLAALANSLLGRPSAVRADLRAMHDQQRLDQEDLRRCEERCNDLRDQAYKDRRELDDAKRRVTRLEDECTRWREDAEHWRQRALGTGGQ